MTTINLPRRVLFATFLAFSILAALTSVPIFAADGLGALPNRAQFDFATDRDNLVIEFTMRHDELAENDPTPLLRIYGDGTVAVHIPEYWQGAGDYRMTLSEPDLRAMIESFATRGVLDFDRARVEASKAVAEEARRRRDNTSIHISDTSWTKLRIHLDRYDPFGTGLAADSLDRQIVWPDVEWHVEHYPEIAALRGLAEAQRAVYALIETAKQTPALAEEN